MSQKNSGEQRGRPFPKGQSGNPAGRPRRSDEASHAENALIRRMDEWHNMITGVGSSTKDKRTAGRFCYAPIGPEEGLNLWLGDDLAARIVEELPSEALRQGFEVKIGADKSLQELKGEAAGEVPGAAGAKPGAGAPTGKPKFPDREVKVPGAKPPPFGKRTDAKPFGEDAPEELDTDDADLPAIDRAKVAAFTPGEEDDTEETDTGEKPGTDPAEIQEWLQERIKELCVVEKLERAACLERATGGAGILLGAVDTTNVDMKTPLTVEGVREFEWMTVLEWRELTPRTYYIDPRAPKYGEVETWTMSVSQPGTAGPSAAGKKIETSQIEIHETRLIIFPGITVSRVRRDGLANGFGDNVFTRIMPVLRDFNSAFAAAGILVQDFAQAIWSIKGLAELVAMDKSGALAARIKGMEIARSTLGATVIDAEGEQFERKATPVNGLPELLDRFERRLAAATGMPLTRLIGSSPGGLNATGESDQAFFYDKVRRFQQGRLQPAIERIVELLLRAAGHDVDTWNIVWPSLWQPTDKERAELAKLIADTDSTNITAGVYTADEAALRYAGEKLQVDLRLDFSARAMADRMEAQEEQKMQSLAEAEAGAAPFGGPPKGPPGAGGPPKPGAKPPFGRQDYDPDQPRDERGRFGEGGGGGKESKEAKATRRSVEVEDRVWNERAAARDTEQRNFKPAGDGTFRYGSNPTIYTAEQVKESAEKAAQMREAEVRAEAADQHALEDARNEGRIKADVTPPEVKVLREARAKFEEQVKPHRETLDAQVKAAADATREADAARHAYGYLFESQPDDDVEIDAPFYDVSTGVDEDLFVSLREAQEGLGAEDGNAEDPFDSKLEAPAVPETRAEFDKAFAAAGERVKAAYLQQQVALENLYTTQRAIPDALKAAEKDLAKASGVIDDDFDTEEAVDQHAASFVTVPKDHPQYEDSERAARVALSQAYDAAYNEGAAERFDVDPIKESARETAAAIKKLAKLTGRKWSAPKRAKGAE